MCRKTMMGSVVVAGAAALAITSGGAIASSSHKLDVRTSGGQSSGGGTKFRNVKAVGPPFGKCLIDVDFAPPVVHHLWHCPGGTFRAVFNAHINGDKVTARPKLYGGKGRYKGISGTLRLTGSLSKNTTHMTGRVRY